MISGGIIVGQYYPVRSLVHSLDPRAKILISMVFMVILFVGNNFYAFAVTGTFAVLAVTLSRIPWKVLVRGLRPIAFIMSFTLVLHLLLTPGQVIFQIGPIKATLPGLIQGIFIALRLIILIMFTSS